MRLDSNFLSPSLRKVVALLIFAGLLFTGGAAAADYVKGIAASEADRVLGPMAEVLRAIDKRLERIERKIDSDR